jgi:hypothetical protein
MTPRLQAAAHSSIGKHSNSPVPLSHSCTRSIRFFGVCVDWDFEAANEVESIYICRRLAPTAIDLSRDGTHTCSLGGKAVELECRLILESVRSGLGSGFCVANLGFFN